MWYILEKGMAQVQPEYKGALPHSYFLKPFNIPIKKQSLSLKLQRTSNAEFWHTTLYILS